LGVGRDVAFVVAIGLLENEVEMRLRVLEMEERI
jgi:hypothetical protein